MRAVFYGSMIPTTASHLVFLLNKIVSQKQQTKCPGIITTCPGITQLPSLVMRECERPLKISLVPCGIILPSLPALVTVNQCPGIMQKTVIMSSRKQCLVLPRRKGIGNIEEREEREKEQREEKCLIMMRAGPISAQATRLVPAQVTQSGLQDSDPISAMRPAVYYPHESVGSSRTNENSPFQIGTDAGEFSGLRPGLYKPTDPASQHDTWTYSSIANSLETGPPSPTRTLAANSSNSRTRPGIVYPLQPRSRRPDITIEVEASLPESAALQRADLQPSCEVPTNLTRTTKRLSRKRRRNRSTALYRPAKRSPPRGRWCTL